MTERPSRVEPPLAQHAVGVAVSTLALVAVLAFAWTLPPEPSEVTRRPATLSALQIDINTAAEEELSLVPGVGPVLAKRIIANRDREGEFPTIESLGRVYGVGPKTLDQITMLCFVDDPATPSADRPSAAPPSADRPTADRIADRR